MKGNLPPKFETKPLTSEKSKKLYMSFEECADLTERDCETANQYILFPVTSKIALYNDTIAYAISDDTAVYFDNSFA